MTPQESEAANAEVLAEVAKIKLCLPHIATWAALSIACERIERRRTGERQMDTDPTGEIATRAESEYAHRDGAHR